MRRMTRPIARRRWLLAGCGIASLLPTTAWAHVKWFEDASRFPLQPDLVFSERTLLWLGASTVALLWLSLAQRITAGSRWADLAPLQRLSARSPTLLSIQAAITLVSTAVQPALLAPNLALPHSPPGIALAAVELVVAATLVTGIADWLGALLLCALVPLVGLLFSPMDALEQLFWVGIAAGVRGGCTPRAVAVLRISTGLAVIAAALSEKLWDPALGGAFMAHHPEFNVLRTQLGMTWFSDDLFVLVAGIVEGTIGVLLVSGCMTRLVILGMWLPFNLGIPVLPAQELIGHLPILAAMYVLLAHGSGSLVTSSWRVPRFQYFFRFVDARFGVSPAPQT
jgi:uncharacterized membrane protein YphA (DoxX/SURF4 family)